MPFTPETATDLLLARTFADHALITAGQAAAALGLDMKTFRTLVEDGAIRSVKVGPTTRTRRFAEAGLRAFLNGETQVQGRQYPPTRPRSVRSGRAISSSADMSDFRAMLRASRLKP